MGVMQRIPPQDIKAEEVVIGCCLQSPDAVGVAMDSLSPEVFYKDAHKEIFKCMFDLFAGSETVDLITVVGRLSDSGKLEQIGGAVYLAEIADVIPMPSVVAGYCRRLLEKYMLRSLIIHCADVIDRCYSCLSVSDVTDFAEAGMFSLVAKHSAGTMRMDGLIKETLDLLELRCKSDGVVTGVPTGFIDLDGTLAGLHGGDLIIMAARPSMGKTALAMNIVQNVAVDHGTAALVFSLEMPGQQLAERMLSGSANVNGQAMRTGVLVNDDWSQIAAAAGKLSAADIFIDSGASLSVVDVRARARRAKSKYGIGLVVIDYLQLMRGTGRGYDRQNEVAEISRGLKSLAKELDVPVLALSQLNRSLESRADKRPMLSDLRESGSLEQDADVIMFIYRDDYYHEGRGQDGFAELIIGKQRSGPIGTIKLVFQKEISTFRSAI